MIVTWFDIIKFFLLFRFLLLLLLLAVVALSCFFRLGWVLLLLNLLAVLLLFLGSIFLLILFGLGYNCLNGQNLLHLPLNRQFDILFPCEILTQQ